MDSSIDRDELHPEAETCNVLTVRLMNTANTLVALPEIRYMQRAKQA